MEKVNFISANITIEEKTVEGKEYKSLKYLHGDKYMYITSKTIARLEEANVEIYVDNQKVNPTKKGLYSGFWTKVAIIKTIAKAENEILNDLKF